jgi:hypothetical protein
MAGVATVSAAIVATYDYVDEAGALLFQVCRKANKDFPQRRPNGNGGWIWNLDSTRRVLYRLPAVIAAVAHGRTVYVDEGEKDVAACEAAGLVATCNPGGAGEWRDEYAEALRGAVVVVVADRDEPGRNHARKVKASLEGVAASVVVVEAATGKDAHDHFAAGLDELDFVPWTDDADPAPATPDEPVPDDDATSVGRIRRALFVDTDDTREGATTPREPVPGTGGLLWQGLAHTFYGDRGEGKSVVVLTVSVSAAVAGEKVLYLDRENGAALTRSLVAGILAAHAWPDVLEVGSWVGRHYPEFSREWVPADYAEAVAGLGYTGVIYDNVREVLSELGGNPNSDEDYSALHRILVTPLLRRGAWVVVLDNVGHAEKSRPKGAGAKVDAVPTGYQVRTTKKFTPTLLGAVEIKCQRSRYGDVGRAWTAEVGAGRFDVPERREASTNDGAVDPVAVVVAALKREAPLGQLKLEAALRAGGVTGKSEVLRDQIKAMASDPECRIHDTGNGYALTAEDPVSRPHVPTPCPCPPTGVDTDGSAGHAGHADAGQGELLPSDDDPEGGDE